MKMLLGVASGLMVAVFLAAAVPAAAQIREAKDPAVKAYLDAYDDEVREQKRAEREARWADPNRLLRPYLTLDEIYERMDRAAADYPDLVSVEDYGVSGEGRPLRMLKIGTGAGDKPSILYSANIHGNELAGNMICLALAALYEKYRFDVHCNWHTTGGDVMSPPATLPEPLADDGLMEEMRRDYQAAMFDPYDEHTELEFYPTIGSLDDYLYHRFGTLCITTEVGKHAVSRLLFDSYHHGTWSPLFWTSNVYAVEREVANNLPGAVRMAWWAARLGDDPSLRRWRPPEELWEGEPEQ